MALPPIDGWRDKCAKYKAYNGIMERRPENGVDPYVFVDRLSEMLADEDVVVVDGGGTCNQIAFQTMRTRETQRLIITGALCAMGSGLPDSVGAAFARTESRVVCYCGDGSFQLNVQELQTLRHHNLRVKVFVFCNDGYLSIRQTQDAFFDSRYTGSTAMGGLSVPDVRKIAEAYGVKTFSIDTYADLQRVIPMALSSEGPAVCALRIPPDSPVEPTVGFVRAADGTGSPRPLEDMAPFLDRQEFLRAMVVKPLP